MAVRQLRIFLSVVLLATAFTAGGAIVAPTEAEAASKDDEQRAEEWITMGLAAFKAKRFSAAALAFQEAHRLDPQPMLVWNIARSFEEAKAWSDAKTWFETFLTGQKPGEKAEEAKRRIATIDAELAAEAKRLEARKLEEARNTGLASQRAKEREEAAKAAAQKKVSEQRQLEQERSELQKKIDEMKALAAQNKALGDKLQKEEAARRKQAAIDSRSLGLLTMPQAPLTPPPSPPTSMSTGGWVSLTLGAVLGGVGAFLFVNGEGIRDDWRTAVANASNGVVTEMTRSESLAAQDDANLQQTLGVVGLSVGGAALITGIILLAVGDPEPETTLSTEITANSVSFKLGGSF